MVRRPLRWELAPAEALRLVRDDAHPVALFGTWAGGADVIAAEPARVRSGPGPLADVFDRPASPAASPGRQPGRADARLRRRLDRVPGLQRGRRGARPGRAAPAAPVVVRLVRQRAGARAGDGGVVLRGAVDGRPRGRARPPLRGPGRRGRPRRLRRAATTFSPFRLSPGAAGHQQAVARAVEYIRAGDIFQANICLRAEAEFAGDPLDAFCQAAAELQPPYAAFIGVSAVPAPAAAPRTAPDAAGTAPPASAPRPPPGSHAPPWRRSHPSCSCAGPARR